MSTNGRGPGPAPAARDEDVPVDRTLPHPHERRPERVRRSERFLRDHGVWHLMSVNPPVRSCGDAAQHRHRLGSVGIPLCDELKSLLYACDTDAGGRGYVLLHCRGHQHVDLEKVAAAVGSGVTAVLADELAHRFGLEYGMVAPFLLAGDPGVRHVVDDTVLARFFSPYTMMTNAGDLRHAVEFRPRELFEVVPDVIVRDIVVSADKRVPRQTLGILTGNSPESGMLLWEKINERIRADSRVRARGDAGFPRLVVDSVPDMGASMELQDRAAEVRRIVLEAVEGLCAAGATVVGVACNTTQYFAEDIDALCRQHGARFVSVAEETAERLRRLSIDEVDLLGIGPVLDLDGWSDFGRALQGVRVRVPPPEQVEEITRLAFSVKRDVVSSSTLNHLRDLVKRATRSATVVVALTELSVLLSRQRGRQRSGKHFIDTLDVLADRMADLYLEERIAAGGA